MFLKKLVVLSDILGVEIVNTDIQQNIKNKCKV
jgi:hypothetical protein